MRAALEADQRLHDSEVQAKSERERIESGTQSLIDRHGLTA